MKKLPEMFGMGLVFLAALLGATGCSKTPTTDVPVPPGSAKIATETNSVAVKSDSPALQGNWKGPEAGDNAAGTNSLVLSGTNLEFHGANPQEWYKATFVLLEDKTPKQLVATITACADPQYVGKTTYAIYQIQDGTFTISAHEPGNPKVPATFDEDGTRKFVFKK